MSLAVAPNPVPLSTDADGVVRVANTRVTLDTIVYAFQDGATADDIAAQFPPLTLRDVYAVITYYLHNREEVDQYLAEAEAHARQVRQENEARFNPEGIKARLLARKAQQG